MGENLKANLGREGGKVLSLFDRAVITLRGFIPATSSCARLVWLDGAWCNVESYFCSDHS